MVVGKPLVFVNEKKKKKSDMGLYRQGFGMLVNGKW